MRPATRTDLHISLKKKLTENPWNDEAQLGHTHQLRMQQRQPTSPHPKHQIEAACQQARTHDTDARFLFQYASPSICRCCQNFSAETPSLGQVKRVHPISYGCESHQRLCDCNGRLAFQQRKRFHRICNHAHRILLKLRATFCFTPQNPSPSANATTVPAKKNGPPKF